MTCDKNKKRQPCPLLPQAVVSCEHCKKVFRRCANHDGMAGADRSLTSHKGMCDERQRAIFAKRIAARGPAASPPVEPGTPAKETP